ncbi:WD40 repeat domain-containing protein [Pseudoalteromonas sp.]|jgi:WD40 repeat protein|uniref:WD40 repeat domain-containing protein n=1 Tax=Pseudoalteromonas sp. TaxID=53249 RepID=UPI003562803A
MSLFRTFLIVFCCLSAIACSDKKQQAVASYEHAAQGAFAAAVSHDGKYSLVSSINHGVALWDNQQQVLKYQWFQQQTQDSLVHTVAIAYDNSVAVTAEKDTFAVWDIATGKNTGYYKIQHASIRDIAISNQGRSVLYGRSDGVVVFINLETGRRIEFLGHQEKINTVDLAPNGRYALSGSNDYVAYFWDTRTGQVIHRFNHPTRVTQVTLDPQGRYAFTADSMAQANVWQLTTGDLVSKLTYIARQKIFTAVRFNDPGTLLATGSPNKRVDLWQISSGEKIQTWQVTPREGSKPKSAVVLDVAFTENGKSLLTESSSGIAERFIIRDANEHN